MDKHLLHISVLSDKNSATLIPSFSTEQETWVKRRIEETKYEVSN